MQQTDRRHSDSAYQRELEELLDRVLFMGARVESLFTDALKGYLRRDVTVATELLSTEASVLGLEAGIDATCVEILSRRQAMASDLRFITMTFKVVRDLQRIGALSVGICRRTLELESASLAHPGEELEQMGAIARDMLRRAIDAYATRDAKLAGEVVAWDRQLDEQYRALWGASANQMSGAPSSVPGLMRLLAVAKSLERIADHAVSISEMVVFMVEGAGTRQSEVMAKPSRLG